MQNQKENRRLDFQKALQAFKAIKEFLNNTESEKSSSLNTKIIQFYECIKNEKSFVWRNEIKDLRNEIAHQKEDFTEEKFIDLCKKISSKINIIEKDLNDKIDSYFQPSKSKRKFEKFAPSDFGTEMDKKQLIDALEDSFLSMKPKDLQIEFPQNKFSQIAKNIMTDIIKDSETQKYISQHNGLSENIQTDILEWLENTNISLDKQNPFKQEAIFIEELKNKNNDTIIANFNAIKNEYKNLPSIKENLHKNTKNNEVNFEFYDKKIKNILEEEKIIKNKSKKDKISVKKEEIENEKEKLIRNLIKDLEKYLIDRQNQWEIDFIDKERKIFLEQLYKKIENFIKIEKLLSPFIKDLGRLWDLSEGIFQTSGFEILQTFADLLEKDKSLRELADMLGKQNRAKHIFEKELRDNTIIKQEYKLENAYAGEIFGVRYSDDISASLPAELALFKNPVTKRLFQLKFAQKQLLSFEYKNTISEQKEEQIKEEIKIEKKEQKGPIIICVDTSGSMQGSPENIAKTITFALAKIALEEKRKCFLISFSTNIKTLDLSDFSETNISTKNKSDLQAKNNITPLINLVKFLQMSFNSGTDITPALSHSLEMLSQDDYKNADVLMISDFVMDNLSNNLSLKIDNEKKKNTQFHSLVIGSSGNKNIITCFNNNWLYDIASIDPEKKLIKQLHSIGTHNQIEIL